MMLGPKDPPSSTSCRSEKKGVASIPIQEADERKNKKPLQAPSKAIIEFARVS
jgi:hypothetical protein